MLSDETKTALIVVRTYPVPVQSGIESSCTAAITDGGEWLRLFPVPWRLLPSDQRFRKYQWVEVKVTKATDDPRPESYKLRQDGIRILTDPLSSANEWQARKDVVYPMRDSSLCNLVRSRNLNSRPTLGFFRPGSIKRLRIQRLKPDWSDEELGMLRQTHLFIEQPKQQLEKIPCRFIYEFACDNEPECNRHNLMCTDWEMSESYRRWQAEYGDGWEEKFRQRYETEMITKNDTHFYVGTVSSHPANWIIIGLFYPPREGENILDSAMGVYLW